jgi:hypothetical protein
MRGSRSENHPVFMPNFDWQKATPPVAFGDLRNIPSGKEGISR